MNESVLSWIQSAFLLRTRKMANASVATLTFGRVFVVLLSENRFHLNMQLVFSFQFFILQDLQKLHLL